MLHIISQDFLSDLSRLLVGNAQKSWWINVTRSLLLDSPELFHDVCLFSPKMFRFAKVSSFCDFEGYFSEYVDTFSPEAQGGDYHRSMEVTRPTFPTSLIGVDLEPGC